MLMNKLKAYWAENGEDHSIDAVSLHGFLESYKNYDIILTAPQVSYRQKEFESVGLPCEGIPSFDYAVGNCANIMKIANRLYAQKK